MKQAEVARRLEWSQSKFNRVENGVVRVSTTDLRAILSIYGIQDENLVKELTTIARAGRQNPPYYEDRDIFPPEYILYLQFERQASRLRQYEALIVPGILQTREYSVAALRAFSEIESLSGESRSKAEAVIERKADNRQNRQKFMLGQPTDIFTAQFILDEGVIRRPVGVEVGDSSVMPQQLRHIQQLARLPNIQIGVLPFALGAHQGMLGSFVLLDFPDEDDASFLYGENALQEIATRDKIEATESQTMIFESLQERAVHGEDLDALLDSAITRLS